MKYIILGGGSRLRALLPIFMKYGEIVGYVPHGHGGETEELINLCIANGIKIFSPDKLPTYTKSVYKDCTYFFVSYGKKINPTDFPTDKLINFHASYLPLYRGGSPINWAILNGEASHGISIHKIDQGLDTGDILWQQRFNMQGKSYRDVVNLVNSGYQKILPKFLTSFDIYWNSRKPQNRDKATYYHKRYPRDSIVSFRYLSADEIYRCFLALEPPVPRPFFLFEGKRYEITDCCVLNNPMCFGVPGRIIGRFGGGLAVVTKSGVIVLRKLLFENQEFTATELFDAGKDLL